MRMRLSWATPLLFSLAAACGPSKPPPTLEEIRQLTKISELMHVHGRTADPLFKKINGDWSQADWAMIADSATRLEAASGRVKALSRGVKWDDWAGGINTKSTALIQAAQAKDVTAAKALLVGMKQDCKSCHGKFR